MKAYSLIFIVLLLFVSTCFAEIIKTNDYKVIESHLTHADQETFIIFDVDDVLLQPQDEILKKQNKPFLETIEKELETRLPETATQDLYSLILLQRIVEPVDKRMKTLIKKLQKKKIKVIALTNCATGSFGTINAMQNWRIAELKHLGYDFGKPWSHIHERFFHGVKDIKRPPMFKKGVVFASGVSKGAALEAFLAYTNLRPKKIIFIDDKRKYLESVEEYTTLENIEFLGIEYTAVKDSRLSPLDEERAKLQFVILEEEQQWLSDEKIDNLLINAEEEA
jgi:hypothetical protein